MKKNKLNILIVIIFSIFLTSCQTAKEVLPKTFSENKVVKELLNVSEDNNTDTNNDTSSGDLESSIIKKIE